MSKVQHYKVRCGLDHNPAPGSFVFEGDHTEVVCGFVYNTHDNGHIEIVLFEPTDIDNIVANYTIINETVDWVSMLYRVLEANPAAKKMWANHICK